MLLFKNIESQTKGINPSPQKFGSIILPKMIKSKNHAKFNNIKKELMCEKCSPRVQIYFQIEKININKKN